jgi:hypothetical protein
MKWFIVVLFAFIAYRWYLSVRKKITLFFDNYEVLLVDREDIERDSRHTDDILKLRPESYDNSIDLRGTPTHLCPCGSNIWNLKVIFDDFEIATYFLDMECVNCGSVATAPTPVDREETE